MNKFTPPNSPRRVWAEVDLEAIRHNAQALKEAAGPGRLYMACVKGNGYGHGMVQVARAALQGGADRLSVAQVEEGIELRQAGIKAPIQILIEPLPEHAKAIFENDLIPTLSSPAVAKEMALRLPGRIKVHVEVDTGMYRVPLKPERTSDFIRLLHSFGVYEVEGIFSHFSCSHFPNDPISREFTLKQLAFFKEIIRDCETNGHRFPLKHMASSGAVALYPEAYLDMIRPGYILYGFPLDWIKLPTKPALSWKTRVWSVLPVAKGMGVGYDRNYIPQKETRIAILATGYADGYPRVLSNLSHVLIRGKRAPVVGLIGMDQMTADVGHIADVSRGDEVVLIGEQEGAHLTAIELADHLKTTAAIFTCSIAHRVERIYLNAFSNTEKL
jgi:alanine racemase